MEEQESTAHLGSLAARLAELDARASDLRTLERSCNASCETLEEQRTQCHGLAEAAAQQIAKTERVRNLLQAQAQTCDGPILQRQGSRVLVSGRQRLRSFLEDLESADAEDAAKFVQCSADDLGKAAHATSALQIHSQHQRQILLDLQASASAQQAGCQTLQQCAEALDALKKSVAEAALQHQQQVRAQAGAARQSDALKQLSAEVSRLEQQIRSAAAQNEQLERAQTAKREQLRVARSQQHHQAVTRQRQGTSESLRPRGTSGSQTIDAQMPAATYMQARLARPPQTSCVSVQHSDASYNREQCCFGHALCGADAATTLPSFVTAPPPSLQHERQRAAQAYIVEEPESPLARPQQRRVEQSESQVVGEQTYMLRRVQQRVNQPNHVRLQELRRTVRQDGTMLQTHVVTTSSLALSALLQNRPRAIVAALAWVHDPCLRSLGPTSVPTAGRIDERSLLRPQRQRSVVDTAPAEGTVAATAAGPYPPVWPLTMPQAVPAHENARLRVQGCQRTLKCSPAKQAAAAIGTHTPSASGVQTVSKASKRVRRTGNAENCRAPASVKTKRAALHKPGNANGASDPHLDVFGSKK